MRLRRKRSTSTSFLIEAMSVGQATALTLAVRVPQLMTGTMRAAETHRMVAEKVSTAVDGAVQGGIEAMKRSRRRAKIVTPMAMMTDMAAVAAAASLPARRKVKSNAKRLTAPTTTKRGARS